MIENIFSARSFFSPGGDMALLFVHGLTSSPTEMQPMADIIQARSGCTVSGILLPGHGTCPENLNQTCWQDWYGAVENEIMRLQAKYEHIIVLGLSMGGLLALHAGGKLDRVDGVVAINVPIFNRHQDLTLLAPLLQYIKPYFPKEINRQMMELERQGRFAYHVMPARAFISMMKLRRVVMRELDGLQSRLLVVQSQQDESVKPQSANYIMERAFKAERELLFLPHSRHIATMGPDQELIVRAVLELMDKINE